MSRKLRNYITYPLVAGALATAPLGCASSQRNYTPQQNTSKYEQVQERNTSKESALATVGTCIGLGILALPMIVLGR